jgi:hypothetical protein
VGRKSLCIEHKNLQSKECRRKEWEERKDYRTKRQQKEENTSIQEAEEHI